MIMQNCVLGHDTVVPMPVYSLAAGMTWVGEDHDVPFHVTTSPPSSAATQNEVLAQDSESSPPAGSMVCSGDQPLPPVRAEEPVPLTIRHSLTDGHEMAVGSDVPEVNDAVHGFGSWVQAEPFQSSTDAPTTAVHDELLGHETPTRPSW
jgi:hypothetical protein